MEPFETNSTSVKEESPLVKGIKFSIVIAAIGVVLCFVFLATYI